MGKKLICVIASICMAIIALASCGSKTIAMDSSGNVKSNGGFVVETQDYVYFINGIESYSTKYKTGSVTKAALMRTKKSNLAKIGNEGIADSEYETVVSKLLVSDDKNAGFYIYGDYVYYAVPSTENNQKGALKSDQLVFFRTKLDASGTSTKIAKEDYPHGATFRYIQSGDKVYLVVYSTNLYIYDAVKGGKVWSYEKTIDEVLFDQNNEGNVFYYTIKPVNEALYDPSSSDAQQTKYQEVHKVTLGNEIDDSLVLNGAGKYVVSGSETQIGNEQSANGFGLTGATFDLLRHVDGTLYFSYKLLDSTIGSTTYVALADSDINAENAKKEENVLNYGDKNASNIFADTSFIISKDCIIYKDGTYGLLKYDYTKRDDASSDLGVTQIYYSSEITGITPSFYKDGYLYYYDSSNYMYRLNVADIIEGNDGEEFKITKLSTTTSWYVPEVISYEGKEYLFQVYSATAFDSYVYAIDMTSLKTAYDAIDQDADDAEDLVKEFYDCSESSKKDLDAIMKKEKFGVFSDADKTTYEDYYKGLADESSN